MSLEFNQGQSGLLTVQDGNWGGVDSVGNWSSVVGRSVNHRGSVVGWSVSHRGSIVVGLNRNRF